MELLIDRRNLLLSYRASEFAQQETAQETGGHRQGVGESPYLLEDR